MTNLTPDTIKPYLDAFVHALDVAKMFVPVTTPTGQEIVEIANLIENVIQTVWFTELLCYLVNEFGDTKPTQEQLMAALKHFAKQLGESK